MSVTFDQAYIKAVASGIHYIAEQEGSVLLSFVRKENKVGEYVFFDRGENSGGMTEVTANKTTTALTDAVLSRRGLVNKLYSKHLYTDKIDDIKRMNDPKNFFVRELGNSAGKQIDDLIIAAAFGDALTGKDGGGSAEALPSGQKIAKTFGATDGMSVEKLIEAQRIFEAAENYKTRYCVMGSTARAQLLALTPVQSVDYNNVKALVSGQIDEFVGFKFIRSERVGLDGSSDQRVLCFTEDALIWNAPEAIEFKHAERDDLEYAQQVSARMSGGAVRLYATGVVEIACTPA